MFTALNKNLLDMLRGINLFLLENELFIENIRKWLVVFLSVIVASVAIRTFMENNKQRKLENTFKMLDYLRRHITDQQIETFKALFQANIASSELAGSPANEFNFDNILPEYQLHLNRDKTFGDDVRRVDYIETMFSEGGCGNGDIENTIQIFNLISKDLNKGKLNERLIWYEYGQLLRTCYTWTKYFDEQPDFRKYGTSFYDDFHKFMRQAEKSNLLNEPSKTYVYLE